jgi:hypothetical protein
MDDRWKALARAQQGMISRRQLRRFGIGANNVRNQVRAGRWVQRTSTVVSVVTGELTPQQRCWLGILHAGGESMVSGLTAAALHGLKRWDRVDVHILVRHALTFDPVDGVRFVRTRRPLSPLVSKTSALPLCLLEPALLLAAAYDVSERAGQGLLAAAVQQKLTSPERLAAWIENLKPLRRAPAFRTALVDIAGGAQSMAEIDIGRVCTQFGIPRPTRQRRRLDADGRLRFTDAEWDLPHEHVLILEVDGAFHMEVEHWEDDIARERALLDPTRHVIRCTASELRHNPGSVIAALIRMGVHNSVRRPVVAVGAGGGAMAPPQAPTAKKIRGGAQRGRRGPSRGWRPAPSPRRPRSCTGGTRPAPGRPSR